MRGRKREQRRQPVYAMIIFILLAGVCIGAIYANNINSIQQEELVSYVQDFFIQFTSNVINPNILLKEALYENGKTIVLLWILGFTIIGIPFMFFILFIKGFMYGFTSAFLMIQFGWKGLWFGFLSYLPQNLIFIPSIIFIAKYSIDFSVSTYGMKKGKVKYQKERTHQMIEYFLVIIIGIACVILGSIVETYFTPILMKILLPDFV